MTPAHINLSSSKVSRFKRWSGNKQKDAADCFTFPANAIGNKNTRLLTRAKKKLKTPTMPLKSLIVA